MTAGILIAVLAGMLWLWQAGNARAAGDADNWPTAPLTVRGRTFRDAHGRQVVLNGINYVDKDAKGGLYAAKGGRFFSQLRFCGFNCVRLGIIWGWLEPRPGKYDEAYLRKIDKAIEWASAQRVYVILDMHQDLYSMKYGEGAPAWATLDGGKPHVRGTVWSDSYMLSPAVQTSFDNFWANKFLPDRKGLQDHYATMWRYVARRYANNDGVIGYDLMNEPFAGTMAAQAMPLMMAEYAKIAAQQTGTSPSPQQLMQIWSDNKARIKAFELLATAKHYAQMIDAAEKLNGVFETGPLQAMYERVANAIRTVDKRHVLFVEHSYLGSLGIRSFLRPLTTKDGTSDPLVAFAPHGYSLLTDTAAVGDADNERLRVIYSRIRDKGQEIGMPVVLGEWGCYRLGLDPKLVTAARYALSLIEEFQLGNTYWGYEDCIGECPYFRQAIMRPYPVCVAGDLKGYRLDHNKHEFEVTWQEAFCDGLPTVIFLPKLANVIERGIVIEPKPSKISVQRMPGFSAGYLLVYPDTANPSRKAVIPFIQR